MYYLNQQRRGSGQENKKQKHVEKPMAGVRAFFMPSSAHGPYGPRTPAPGSGSWWWHWLCSVAALVTGSWDSLLWSLFTGSTPDLHVHQDPRGKCNKKKPPSTVRLSDPDSSIIITHFIRTENPQLKQCTTSDSFGHYPERRKSLGLWFIPLTDL